MSAGDSTIDIDEYEQYNYEEFNNGRGGKNRTKVEQQQNSNRHDPCGHTRKILEKLVNTEKNKREEKK